MCLETASQIASVISPFISLIAIFTVFRVYKSQKKIDLEIEVRCDFSAWVAAIHNNNNADFEFIHSSWGNDMKLELDRIQTKTFLCGEWIEEIRKVILDLYNWTKPNVITIASDDVKKRRIEFYYSINHLRSKMREERNI